MKRGTKNQTDPPASECKTSQQQQPSRCSGYKRGTANNNEKKRKRPSLPVIQIFIIACFVLSTWYLLYRHLFITDSTTTPMKNTSNAIANLRTPTTSDDTRKEKEVKLEPPTSTKQHEHPATAGTTKEREQFPVGCSWKCYFDRYPDLEENGIPRTKEDAFLHWGNSGEKEGRKCDCVAFPVGCSWECYLDRYPDLEESGIPRTKEDAFFHWGNSGEKEGRDCHCWIGDVRGKRGRS